MADPVGVTLLFDAEAHRLVLGEMEGEREMEELGVGRMDRLGVTELEAHREADLEMEGERVTEREEDVVDVTLGVRDVESVVDLVLVTEGDILPVVDKVPFCLVVSVAAILEGVLQKVTEEV